VASFAYGCAFGFELAQAAPDLRGGGVELVGDTGCGQWPVGGGEDDAGTFTNRVVHEKNHAPMMPRRAGIRVLCRVTP
jgi:hypothetical protein